jgi:TolB-like protein
LRKAGSTMRVAARLVRADSGFVVWSETYDRRLDDILKVQDDIAGEVTKALRQSIDNH